MVSFQCEVVLRNDADRCSRSCPDRHGVTAYFMHSIRLRGPWELQLPGGEARRIEMPATWGTILALAQESPVRLVRRFGQPTGIGPEDRLNLVIESAGCACRVELNEKHLGDIAFAESSSSFDVTALLAPRNELAIALEPAPLAVPSEAIPVSDVRLEIT